jgi:hypothetical protein
MSLFRRVPVMWVALTKTNTPLTWPATTVKQRPVSESVISDGKEILRRKVRRSFRSSDVDHMRGRDIRMTRTILQTMAFGSLSQKAPVTVPDGGQLHFMYRIFP